MCILSTDAYVMYISFLLLLFAYEHVICILSEHMHIMRTLSAVVLDIFLPNRQCRCHPYVISSTLYISYHVQLKFLHIVCTDAHCPCHLHVVHTCTHHLLVIFTTPHIPYYPQLSFHTSSTHMHIVHVICMLSAHVHIICLSSLPFLIYLIIHNLVSAHCLHTCILSMSSVYCLEMHMLCTCHLYCCYLYMYMSSTYYLGIYVLCAHYLQWSLICSFLTDNTNVIHTSSLVVFIYSIMENMSSAPLLDDMSSTPLPDDMSSAPLPDHVSSAPLPDDVSSAPLLDDMSSAHQRNMSYLFEV